MYRPRYPHLRESCYEIRGLAGALQKLRNVVIFIKNLDPRSTFEYFKDEDESRGLRGALEDALNKSSPVEYHATVEKSWIYQLFGKQDKRNEVMAYIALGADQEADAFVFCTKRPSNFPVLSKFDSDLLVTPATSVPCD